MPLKLHKILIEQKHNYSDFNKYVAKTFADSINRGAAWLDDNTTLKIVSEFSGICTAVIYDGIIDNSEITLLYEWAESRREFLKTNELVQFVKLLKSVNGFDRYSEPFKAKLLKLLTKSAHPTGEYLIKKIFDTPEFYNFSNKVVVLTGNFITGEKKMITSKLVELGAIVKEGFSKQIDCLIVGAKGSAYYLNGMYGTKIGNALQLKKSGSKDIIILHEEHFVKIISESK